MGPVYCQASNIVLYFQFQPLLAEVVQALVTWLRIAPQKTLQTTTSSSPILTQQSLSNAIFGETSTFWTARPVLSGTSTQKHALPLILPSTAENRWVSIGRFWSVVNTRQYSSILTPSLKPSAAVTEMKQCQHVVKFLVWIFQKLIVRFLSEDKTKNIGWLSRRKNIHLKLFIGKSYVQYFSENTAKLFLKVYYISVYLFHCIHFTCTKTWCYSLRNSYTLIYRCGYCILLVFDCLRN